MTVGECIEILKKKDKNAKMFMLDRGDWSGYDILVDFGPGMIRDSSKIKVKNCESVECVEKNSVVIG